MKIVITTLNYCIALAELELELQYIERTELLKATTDVTTANYLTYISFKLLSYLLNK